MKWFIVGMIVAFAIVAAWGIDYFLNYHERRIKRQYEEYQFKVLTDKNDRGR